MITARSTRTRRCTFGPVVVRFDDRVVTPRPCTLLQSRWVVELSPTIPAGPILELCAGAGHIGLAAAVLTGRDLVQVETDPIAAGNARSNAAAARCANLVQVRTVAKQTALAPDERFPVVIADLPYLPTADVTRWPADPVTAIDGGDDGLDLVRVCLAVAARHLTPAGAVLLQVAGAAQALAVTGPPTTVPGPPDRCSGLRRPTSDRRRSHPAGPADLWHVSQDERPLGRAAGRIEQVVGCDDSWWKLSLAVFADGGHAVANSVAPQVDATQPH